MVSNLLDLASTNSVKLFLNFKVKKTAAAGQIIF